MVLFESGSASPSPRPRAVLDNFAAPYTQLRLTSRVQVYAWADSVGSRGFNLRLSPRRGKAVRDYLVSRGVPKTRVVIRAYGEEESIVATPDETPSEANRAASVVEVVSEAEMARRKTAWSAFPHTVC
jgi:peptidoglycan-associated lipoprotein